MKITAQQLLDAGCCLNGVDKYFKYLKRKQWDAKKLLHECIDQNDHTNGYTALSKLMTKNQRVKWAIYCAEQVLPIFETKYPDDKRPRQAVEAAKKYLKNPTAAYAAAAYAAAAYAADAADAAYAADVAADAANAANAAYAAYVAAANAADVTAAAANAADAAYAAAKVFKNKLLTKGLLILMENK